MKYKSKRANFLQRTFHALRWPLFNKDRAILANIERRSCWYLEYEGWEGKEYWDELYAKREKNYYRAMKAFREGRIKTEKLWDSDRREVWVRAYIVDKKGSEIRNLGMLLEDD
jgi:hypothetical protein